MNIEKVIARLEAMPKQGASYDQKGRHGWRNPIRADTGALLQSFVMARNPKRILEIGTAHGLSACYLGTHLKDGSLDTIEWDEETATEAQANLDEAGINAKVYSGNALEVIPTLPGTYQLVFLDANKDGYLEQFQLLRQHDLLDENCLILADNVIDREKECANFLEFMQQFSPVIIPTECGLLVARI